MAVPGAFRMGRVAWIRSDFGVILEIFGGCLVLGMAGMTSPVMDIGLPEKIRFRDHLSHIEIVRTWFGTRILFLTAFAVFWDGFMLHWYSIVPLDGPRIAVLFPLMHVGVGVALTYYVLTGWFNKTTISVGQGRIRVRHRPFPWPGNKDFGTTDVKQLYAKANNPGLWHWNFATVAYELRAVTKSGLNIKLVGGLEAQEQAIFIEQKIEKYLRIKDAPVAGEICRHRS